MKSARFAGIALTAALAAAPAASWADVIVISRGNKRLEGKILQEDERTVTLRVRGSDMVIPRDIIASIEREEGLTLEESEGDAAFAGHDYERALERYRAALETAQDEKAKARAQEKIRQARRSIETRDQELVGQQFREFERFLGERDFRQAEQVLDRVQRSYQGNPIFERAVRRNRARLHCEKAAKALDSVNAPLAEREVQEAIKLDAEYHPAHQLAGRIYFDGGQREKALLHYRQTLETGADALDAATRQQLTHRVAELLFQLGRPAEALPLFTELRAASDDPFSEAANREVECLRLIGDQAIQSGNVDRAIETFQKAIESNPDHPSTRRVRLQLGKLYLDSGQPEKALEHFTRLTRELREQLAYSEVYYLIAQCHMRRGDNAKAIEALRSEIALNPSRYIAFIDLARLYIQTSQYVEAEKTLERAIALNADPHDAYLMLGRLRRLQKRYDDAKGLFQQVLAKDPSIREATLLLGQVYLEEKDYENSARYFDQIFQHFNSKPNRTAAETEMLIEAHIGRGRVDLERQQARLALDRFNEALQLNADRAETRRRIGDAYQKLGSYDRAEEAYKAAINLEQNNPEHVLPLALLYHNNLKKPEEAVKHYYLYFDRGGQDYANVNKWLVELGAQPRQPAS